MPAGFSYPRGRRCGAAWTLFVLLRCAARLPVAVVGALPLLLGGMLLLGGSAPAQAAVPPGWEVRLAFTESGQPWFVRAFVQTSGGDHLVAIRNEVFRVDRVRPAGREPWFAFGAGADVAFLVPLAGGHCAVGELGTGRVIVLDAAGRPVTTFQGCRNTYDAVACGVDLLVCANPTWPAGGADTGLWLLGPGRVPREILRLVGPSAPLAWRANGDLVVGELGPIVPPPPGTARLLRIPAARIAAAVAGATLSMADVTAIGGGYDGISDLAVDDADRVHVTAPASSVVRHTAPGGMTPVGVTLDVGAGSAALGLQLLPAGAAPFRGFQPRSAAPRLLVTTSDFTTSFRALHVVSARPRARVSIGHTLPVGAFTVDVTGAPPQGLAVAFASAPAGVPEFVLGGFGGVPLWIGLDPGSAFVVTSAFVDTAGAATLAMWNPGGVPGPIDLQILAAEPFASGDVGTTAVLHLDLLP